MSDLTVLIATMRSNTPVVSAGLKIIVRLTAERSANEEPSLLRESLLNTLESLMGIREMLWHDIRCMTALQTRPSESELNPRTNAIILTQTWLRDYNLAVDWIEEQFTEGHINDVEILTASNLFLGLIRRGLHAAWKELAVVYNLPRDRGSDYAVVSIPNTSLIVPDASRAQTQDRRSSVSTSTSEVLPLADEDQRGPRVRPWASKFRPSIRSCAGSEEEGENDNGSSRLTRSQCSTASPGKSARQKKSMEDLYCTASDVAQEGRESQVLPADVDTSEDAAAWQLIDDGNMARRMQDQEELAEEERIRTPSVGDSEDSALAHVLRLSKVLM